MTDRPILFSGPMVRALLDGRKTMTRRVLKPQPPRREHYGRDIMDWGLSGIYRDDTNASPSKWWLDVQTDVDDNSHNEIDVRFAVGQRRWVREAWRTLQTWDCLAPRHLADDRSKITYEADSENRNPIWAFGKPRRGFHMPRWASRLTLLVSSVKVERLQCITEDDAIAEGVARTEAGFWNADPSRPQLAGCDARGGFYCLWNSINGDKAWEADPWVVAVGFSAIHANIDSEEARAAA